MVAPETLWELVKGTSFYCDLHRSPTAGWIGMVLPEPNRHLFCSGTHLASGASLPGVRSMRRPYVGLAEGSLDAEVSTMQNNGYRLV